MYVSTSTCILYVISKLLICFLLYFTLFKKIIYSVMYYMGISCINLSFKGRNFNQLSSNPDKKN